MQAQLPPSEPFRQNHVSSAYAQSTTVGNNSRNSNSGFGQAYHSQHSNQDTPEAEEMSQYPQYPASYAQAQQQQQQQQPQQRSFLPTQLPPLGPGMGPPGINLATHAPYMAGQQPSVAHQPQQSLATPSTRTSVGNPPQERKMFSSTVRGNLRYTLDVVQQPQRARMCGFGDKDRRPITPPPCVRLIITNEETGHEIPVEDVNSDPSFFVLQVDLWADNADREANVVRASSNSPAVSISSATTTSYPPPADTPRISNEAHPMLYLNNYGQQMYVPNYPVPLARDMPPHQYGHQMHYQPSHPPMPMQPFMPAPQPNNAMYTRNLIGSLTVNASTLRDTENKVGYWFVLQDLSVRTEGFFRLRMSFIDISSQGGSGVYSAKKFPGVIESTSLSKSFASQGIKIPIRKDNKAEQVDEDDGE